MSDYDRFRILLDKRDDTAEELPYWTLREFTDRTAAEKFFSTLELSGNDIDFSGVQSVRLLGYIGPHPFLLGKHFIDHKETP